VGDANHDHLDYLGTGVVNQVPAYLVTVGYNIETPDDDWFACLEEGSHEPALAVGRLPARKAEDVATYVRKVVAYESLGAEDWQKRFVFLADHDTPDNAEGPYESFQKDLAGSLRARGYVADLLTLRPGMYGNPPPGVRPTVTNQLSAAVGAGCAVLVYQGHGDEFYWSRERVLTLEDVPTLVNGARLPVIVEVSCFTGSFDSPEAKHPSCVAEALLLDPHGGAIATVSAARLGGLNIDKPFIEALTRTPAPTLGEAFMSAKSSLGVGRGELWELQATYNLLGDPAIQPKLRPPAQ
jgi:hypothetical protein